MCEHVFMHVLVGVKLSITCGQSLEVGLDKVLSGRDKKRVGCEEG